MKPKPASGKWYKERAHCCLLWSGGWSESNRKETGRWSKKIPTQWSPYLCLIIARWLPKGSQIWISMHIIATPCEFQETRSRINNGSDFIYERRQSTKIFQTKLESAVLFTVWTSFSSAQTLLAFVLFCFSRKGMNGQCFQGRRVQNGIHKNACGKGSF